ncbi:ABC transporter permease [Nesterenkonia alba]|uniref:ABC transporter permease n=1 Tax=Nesterenkonia alba TaxID=515814 RepID=UPI0003B36902|nr:ABC transporter permease [Nesterenkonia alba]
MSSSAPEHTPSALGAGSATMLVAEREITTQVRSKAFLISLVIMVILVIGGIVLTGVFGSDDDPTPVAVTDVSEETSGQLEAAGLELHPVESMTEAEQLLREEDVEAIVTSDGNSPTGTRVIGLDTEPTEVAGLLSVAPSTSVLEEDATDGGLRVFVAMGFSMVFMIVGIGSGMMIVQNTIQEKQNRIVELLLAAVSARALLAGKVLGNTVVAIGQAVVLAAATAAGLMLSGQEDLLDMLTVPMLWFVVFFVPGFVLVAALFAAGASLVSRQEDSGTVITPAMMVVMAPYFVVIFFLNNTAVLTAASYVPFSAPVAMPLRMFFGEAEWFEPLIALGLLGAASALVIAVAARIYSRSLLRTGQPVSLRAALSSSD